MPHRAIPCLALLAFACAAPQTARTPDSSGARAPAAVVMVKEHEYGVVWRMNEAGEPERETRVVARIERIEGRDVSPGNYRVPAGARALRVHEDRDGAVIRFLLEADLKPGRIYALDGFPWWDDGGFLLPAPRSDGRGMPEIFSWDRVDPRSILPRAELRDVTDTFNAHSLRRLRPADLPPLRTARGP